MPTKHRCGLLVQRKDDWGVYPQDWFNHGNFDFGYQWLTRIARDTETGEITGDGIRIELFALDDSYRQLSTDRLRRWLHHD